MFGERKTAISTLILALIFFGCSPKVEQEQKEVPECVHMEKAQLIFPTGRAAQDGFYSKLDSLISGDIANLDIWQVGGSHIQGDSFPQSLMDNFHELGGHGDFGIIFPRQLAGTTPYRACRMTIGGEWEAPMLTKPTTLERPRYGITGFGARCDSAAWIGLNTDPDKRGNRNFTRLRILGYGSSEKAYPEIIAGDKTLQHTLDTATASYVFDLPEATDSVLINFIVPEGETFVLNGIQPLTGNKGVNFFASGVNGAQVKSWIEECADLERDMQIVSPDLAIFGLGINDSACDSLKFSPETFKSNYRRLADMVRRISPDCAMIFITNNDSYRYVKGGMEYNRNADEVRKAMVELAMEYEAGVWDLYGLMGGRGSVYTWREQGLICNDQLHFTCSGYRLLGRLLYEAIITDWNNTRK